MLFVWVPEENRTPVTAATERRSTIELQAPRVATGETFGFYVRKRPMVHMSLLFPKTASRFLGSLNIKALAQKG